MIEWEATSIGKLCDAGLVELQTGPFGSQLHAYDYVSEGVPVVPTEAIWGRQIDHSVLPKISREKADALIRHRLLAGDILFARRGVQATGHIGYVRERENGFICGTGAIRLRLNRNNRRVSSEFLSHVLAACSSIEWFKSHAIGATMPNLNESIIRAFPLILPPFPEQQSISEFLSSLDDKIELNRRMNETLEAITQALFKSWFVDFDPVRVLAGQLPEQPPFLVKDNLRKIGFPDRFQDSELGEVPAGWEVSGLDGIAEYLNGLALQKFPPQGDNWLPVIKIAQLRAGDTDGSDRASTSIPAEYVVDDGDVLFSWSGSLEVEVWCGGRGALNQHLFKVRSKRFPKWFYFLWTREHLADFREIARDKATTMGHIQRQHLGTAKALVPPPKLLYWMDRYFEPLLNKHIANRLESRTLGSLRDALLPKLLSGELRVQEAESIAARVDCMPTHE
jgi:type I restriction enzyme S subunit